jgi:hypothetical protein
LEALDILRGDLWAAEKSFRNNSEQHVLSRLEARIHDSPITEVISITDTILQDALDGMEGIGQVVLEIQGKLNKISK